MKKFKEELAQEELVKKQDDTFILHHNIGMI
jgi:hypothetical protein